MIGFWISASAMGVMVALVLIQALRQGRATRSDAGPAPDLAVYRDQMAEVERDLARGTLAEAEAERLRTEVQRRMLDAGKAAQPDLPRATGYSFPAAAGAVVLALGLAGYVYTVLGVPDYPDLPLSGRLADADASYKARPSQVMAEAAVPAYVAPTDLDPKFAAMIDRLRAAVALRPDDLQGHILLAQNEVQLGNYAAARKAQETVVRLKGAAVTAADMQFLAMVMIDAAGGAVTPEAEQALIGCLQIDPGNGWARFYSGLMFGQVGRPDRMFALWQPLLAEGPADAPWIKPIRDRIEDVAAAAGVNFTLPDAAPGPDAAAVAAAAGMSAADRQGMIKTMVDGLEARLNGTGGTVEDWGRLITALGVLQDMPRAKAAYDRAQKAFAGKPGELAALHAAAVQAGVAQAGVAP